MPRVSQTRTLSGSWALPASVMLVAAVAPFERALPGSAFGFTLTTVELAIVIALAIGAIAWLRQPAAFEWRTPISLAARRDRDDRVRRGGCRAGISGRRRSRRRAPGRRGAAVHPGCQRRQERSRLARQIAAALLASASIVGVIAVLELAQVPWVLDALKTFRPGFHVVGGQVRATSTLFYPTITSMFLEVAFALGLVWLSSSRLAFAGLVLTGAGVIATFTRSGLITITMSLALYGAVLYLRRRQWGSEHRRLAVLAAVLVALVLMSRSPQMLFARMSVEGSQDWYGAVYDVPRQLTMRPDSFNDVEVTLSNEGRLTWQSTAAPPFSLSYHFLQRRH